ncbi:MAG: alkyl hydroperoxide reductase subunit F [Clostridiales bacterium]|nr:alkyl hydroperoxide reductase subunit F [Clostridiales bacterium]
MKDNNQPLLDEEIRLQIQPYLEYIECDVVLGLGESTQSNSMVAQFVMEISELSDKISYKQKKLERPDSFSIDRKDWVSGIVFSGIPLGHEFDSFVMALIHVSGRKPKIDDKLIEKIKSIKQKLNFVTYISLSCHNCPEVVQSLNILSVLNDNITHTTVEGGNFADEVEQKQVLSVPTVWLNDKEWVVGRFSLHQILEKLGVDNFEKVNSEPYDLMVIGGGPAGVAAAIYAARKGIKTGLLSQNIGGQVLDTLSIENIIGIKNTTGPQFVDNVKNHLSDYPIDMILGQQVSKLYRDGDYLKVSLSSGANLTAATAVIATGAKWRDLGIEGETEFKNKGISYCPHCDGPLYKNKDIVIVGGGNSGVEAAIDLAKIVKSIVLLEYADSLKADSVLIERLKKFKNIRIVTRANTQKISGSSKVEKVSYLDMSSNKTVELKVQGIFILIGLFPNTKFLQNTVDLNQRGEIIVDKFGATSMQGVYAAGDCTDSVYKQIVISLGSGATAALSAYDCFIKNYLSK